MRSEAPFMINQNERVPQIVPDEVFDLSDLECRVEPVLDVFEGPPAKRPTACANTYGNPVCAPYIAPATLDQGVLDGLNGPDEVERHPSSIGPLIKDRGRDARVLPS